MSKKEHIINAGIQLVPFLPADKGMLLIADCILLIKKSGLNHEVNAMETVVEGNFSEISQLIKTIHACFYKENIQEYLLNIRFHISNEKDIRMKTKTEKFRNEWKTPGNLSAHRQK